MITTIVINISLKLKMTIGPQGIPESEHDQLSTAWGHFWWILSGQDRDQDDDDDDDVDDAMK